MVDDDELRKVYSGADQALSFKWNGTFLCVPPLVVTLFPYRMIETILRELGHKGVGLIPDTASEAQIKEIEESCKNRAAHWNALNPPPPKPKKEEKP